MCSVARSVWRFIFEGAPTKPPQTWLQAYRHLTAGYDRTSSYGGIGSGIAHTNPAVFSGWRAWRGTRIGLFEKSWALGWWTVCLLVGKGVVETQFVNVASLKEVLRQKIGRYVQAAVAAST